MKSDELRKTFLAFFREKGHSVEAPASLIPKNDTSLLFTGAGMNQFKKLFLATREASPKKVTTCQRCLRATDIENVGKTSRHLTFLEMLGNFSFGDYFKKEAITWALEFMLEALGLSQDRLLITVYKDDPGAIRIWEEMGIRKDKIVLMGEKDNFWSMGETGPCGPCSEILIDRGEEYSCGKDSCGPACGCDRYLEVWNLVFTQFNRRKDGTLETLSQKNIDTGMGLERIASIMQDVTSVFDIDIVLPIIDEIRNSKTEAAGDKDRIIPARIVADHTRAITFCIADGIIPSNEGRGYVLRKLIRRAVENGKKLGKEKPFLYKLIPLVINQMQSFYPDLHNRDSDICPIVKSEEERFFAVFQRLPELEEEITALLKRGEKKLRGDLYFKYYDTYGIPQETIAEVAETAGMQVDNEGFTEALDFQRRRSRSASGFAVSHEELPEIEGKTEFAGYETLETDGKILAIVKEAKEVEEARKGETIDLITDKTPFYAEAGGQVGDEGQITGQNGILEVRNTVKSGNLVLHHGTLPKGALAKGDTVKLTVSGETRSRTAANHTVTHLLHYSLRNILGKHVRQCGSFVSSDRLRFDFTHTNAISHEELSRIEELVNKLIAQNSPVKILNLPMKEARKTGAISLFGEKYGKIVRVIKIGDYSLELCGGTHVESTGEIGIFLIESESSISSGIRRIEAISSSAVYSKVKMNRLILSHIGQTLKASPEDLPEKVERLVKREHSLENELENIRTESAVSKIDEFISRAEVINGIRIVAEVEEALSKNGLRRLTDMVKQKLGSGVVVLGTITNDGKVLLCTSVTDNLIKQGLHAGKIVKEVAAGVGGSGGGRADFAQAGGKDASRLKITIKTVPEIVKMTLDTGMLN